MYINHSTLSCKEGETVLFADDTTILIFHADKMDNDIFVENMEICENWFEKSCVTIKESKLHYMNLNFGIKKYVELETFQRKHESNGCKILRYFD